MVHPVLVGYLNQLIGYGFRLDREPELIGETDGAAGGLIGGNEPMDAGRAYYILNGRRHCQGIHAIWALAGSSSGDGGFSLVPCSHKSNVETPEDVLTGQDDLGLTVQPALNAGDLLLCAATLLQGVRSGTEASTRNGCSCTDTRDTRPFSPSAQDRRRGRKSSRNGWRN